VFANTHGRKFDLGSGNRFKTAMTADLYDDAERRHSVTPLGLQATYISIVWMLILMK
jgi:hypothetical protein